jgi:phenol 2-monooxygenase
LITFDRELSEFYSTEPRAQQSKDSEHIAQWVIVVFTSKQVLMLSRCRKFQTYSAFTSGISVQYAESAIVDAKHQSFAKNLIIGQRMLPQILICAADARPYELQDLLPADTRFKVLIFAGDTTNPTQHMKVSKLAEAMASPESFLWKHAPGNEWNKAFDILTISSGKKELVSYIDLPKLFGSHWSK